MALLGFGRFKQKSGNDGSLFPMKDRSSSSSDRQDFDSFTSSPQKQILSGNKPLPLKQRTSSSSNHRDYNQKTWLSLLVLLKFREFFITVDHFSIWRRHMAWANDDGKDLRTYMTQRYASNMVFMSLLLSTELGVLFNSAHVTTQVRENLVNSKHASISFWAGLLIIISALFTILSLISTFTAWAMVSSIDEVNAHCILRSSIGQYAAELPGRLIVCSIYSFLISFMLFFFLLLPIGFWSILLLVCTSTMFFHVVSVFSGFGRIIMHSGAMSKQRIFSPEYEEFLVPESLHSNLLKKAKCNLAHNTSIIRQYRRKQQPINRSLEEEQLWEHLNGKTDNHHFSSAVFENPGAPIANRSRADSTVRFADEEQGLKSKDESSFPSNRVVRTGSISGNLKQSSYLGQHHRTTTPLSALSEGTHRSSISEITFDTPRPKIPPKERGHRLPPAFNRDESSVRNVSTASLEQWLQGASHDTILTNQDGSKSAKKSRKDGKKNEIQSVRAASPQLPDDSLPLSSFNSSLLDADTNKSVNQTLSVLHQTESDSVYSHDQLSTSSGARSDKLLSEEERFAMDYGDFDSDEDEFNRLNNGEYNYLANSHQVENHRGVTNSEDERSSLLGNFQNRNAFYSGEPPLPQNDLPIPRSTLKRSSSKQESL
ncbi:hypothetical protein IV203_034823 [Nitzschia inconspicua]|uniref:Uncharacterized protein n=1 Tax=Nitzschia inconspicua TaxID=303405 RepID=A0A9K3PTZ6_9STRA|nr:hypothetical protein IV203_034823 [Nitzschia inconspicua]